MTEEDAPRPIDVLIHPRALPGGVGQVRLEFQADNQRLGAVAAPRIAAVAAACRLVAQDLESHHRYYIDNTDLDPTGYSRGAALWLLAGRHLGLHAALWTQIEAGICNETMATGRAMHEVAQMLFAFGVFAGDDLVRLWLDDPDDKWAYVKQPQARKAQAEFEEQLAEVMAADGLPAIRSTKDLVEDLYDQQSRIAHSRRSSCIDSLWMDGRRMSYGPHESWLRRAAWARWAATMTQEMTNAVGDALRGLYGDEHWFTRHAKPLRDAVEAVIESNRLDERSLREAAHARP